MKTSQLKETLRNFRRSFKNNWSLFKESTIGLFGLGIIIFFVVIAVFAPVLTDRDPVSWRAPEEDVIGIDKYWINDLKIEHGSLGGNASMAFVPEGLSFDPRTKNLYLGASNKVFALNPDYGYELWSSPVTTIGDISTSIIAVNFGDNWGTFYEDFWVYAGTSEGYFYAINDTGEGIVESQKKLDGAVSSIAIYNNESSEVRGPSDVIYVGTANGTLYSFSALDHSELWNISLDGKVQLTSFPLKGKGSYPIYSPCLTQDGDILVAGTDNGKLHSISTLTQTELWNYTLAATTWSSTPVLSVEGEVEVVYFGTDDGWLYALYATNGTEIKEWKD
ncbi:MAG: PQQ-binding-like beta-propeller repeat protein, partial [Thermoplasmata archaeon]|nr:PQQ-binding-like beta-propeller repeat protein [Thermoplasmata archaeon]